MARRATGSTRAIPLRCGALLTDFGTRDHYVGAMKGVILTACPGATLIDISHQVPPQDVVAGALLLSASAPYMPPGTVHAAVVDPGVGTDRVVLAGRYGGRLFVFPDNGIITLTEQVLPAEALHVVTRRELTAGRSISRTFHGRDIFAPVVAALLNGMPLERVGPPARRYRLLELPAPVVEADRIEGGVIYVDGFGNLVTNITVEMLRRMHADPDRLYCTCGGEDIGPLKGTYGQVEKGSALVLVDSMDRLEVAVNGGSAARQLGASVGTPVQLVARKVRSR